MSSPAPWGQGMVVNAIIPAWSLIGPIKVIPVCNDVCVCLSPSLSLCGFLVGREGV